MLARRVAAGVPATRFFLLPPSFGDGMPRSGAGILAPLPAMLRETVDLQALIARQRPGWSLEQPFYTSPEIFETERRGWLPQQWFVLGHGSEKPAPGRSMGRGLLRGAGNSARD